MLNALIPVLVDVAPGGGCRCATGDVDPLSTGFALLVIAAVILLRR